VLIQLPWPAILTGLAALALVAAYPFMKRITWWPQAWLGLTFNWGVPVAGAAALGTPFAPEILALYAALIAWTVGYDTIYACQDMEDDALVGVKSSARAMGDHIYRGVLVCYGISVVLVLVAGVIVGAGLFFALGFALYAAHLFSQLSGFDPDDGVGCLKRFKANQMTGLILVAAFLLGAV
jgi:4-hydroxybenzoate polyprenyltransferase